MRQDSKILFEVNYQTIKSFIERRLDQKVEQHPVKHAWMSIGSQVRKEQLLLSDQDNAIIFEDVCESQLDTTKSYFIKLAKIVNKSLYTIGFDYCPADMMARNPRWCLPLRQWKEQFENWMVNPENEDILLCSIFFDYDISYGDVHLTNQLADHIFHMCENNQIFLAAMASVSLRSPSPLGFFRQFLIERNGEHKDFFDLKKRALMPITDAGRVLILQHKIKNINNTAERFEKLASIEPQNSELYLSCSYAAKALLKFRTKQG